MPASTIPFITNVDDMDEYVIQQNYYSYDASTHINKSTHYILKSTIDNYEQNPYEGLNMKTSSGVPLLFFALSIDRIKLVRKLVSMKEYNIYSKDTFGNDIIDIARNTELLYRYYSQYPSLIDAILKKGVNISKLVPDSESQVANRCFKSGTTYLLNMILDTESLNTFISEDYEHITRMFISNVRSNRCGTNDYNEDEYNETTYLNIFDKLLNHVPDNSLVDQFIDMCEYNLTKFIIMSLNRSKVDIYRVTNDCNPLMLAVSNNNIEMTKLLLTELNLDVNRKNTYGYPLTVATRWNNIEMINLLKQNGALLNVTNLLGRTPYELAKQFGTPEVAYHVATNYKK